MGRGNYTSVGTSGMAGTAKTFGEGMLVGGVIVGIGALLLRHAVIAQRQYVAAINRPRYR